MEISPHSEPNIYSLEPREILLEEDERRLLARETQALVDEAFIYNNFCEEISTSVPIELDADRTNAPNATFRALMKVYNRANIQISLDNNDGDSYLDKATITLFNTGRPIADGAELVIMADERDNDDGIDLNNLQYFLKSLRNTSADSPDIIPLDYSACIDILNGLVTQANPVEAITKPNRTILESLHALIVAAPEYSIGRRTGYRFTHPQRVGSVAVNIHDRSLHKKDKVPTHAFHEVSVESEQPLSETDVASTILYLSSSRRDTNTQIGVNYTHYGDNRENIDWYDDLIKHVTIEYNDTTVAHPSKFGQQLMQGLHMLLSTPEDYVVEELEY